jgi:hypothetical protein
MGNMITAYDIISTLIISLQSLSFFVFVENRDYVKRIIYSIHIFILIGIILTLIDIVFFTEAYFTKWYSYITLILGLYNIMRLMITKININMVKISVKIIFIVVFILIIFLQFIYIKISKDVYYTSWDYIAFYYPNSQRLIEKKFIIPELYIPAVLYGAPETVVSIISNLVIHNTFGSALYFYVLSIIIITIIIKNLSKLVFILLNPIVLIFYASYLGYTEYILIWLLASSYYIIRHFKNNDIIYFVISFWLSFLTKPYVALAFFNILMYIIFKKLFKNASISIIKILIIIEFLMVFLYSIKVYYLVKFSVYSIVLLLISLDLIVKYFHYTKHQYRYDFDIIINNKSIIGMLLTSIPFIVVGIYIFFQTKLFLIAPLISPWYENEVRKWTYPVDNTTQEFFYDLNIAIVLIIILTYLIFRKFIIDDNKINNLEYIYILGLLPSLFVVLDYWPREFIRRILILYLYEILLISTIIKNDYKINLLNLYYLSLFILSFTMYYYHEISNSWFEVVYLSVLKTLPSISTITFILVMFTIHKYYNLMHNVFNNTLKIMIWISSLLLFIIEFTTVLNINNISYSREYLSINYWTIDLITDISQLNSSSILTCGFSINKLIGLRSYDVWSFQQSLFIHIILNKGYNITYFNVTRIVYFDTPNGIVCREILNNKTIPILSEYVTILRISR